MQVTKRTPRADNAERRHADSNWPDEAVSAYRPSDHYSEPRARFGGAILLLWVVAFIAITTVWELFK